MESSLWVETAEGDGGDEAGNADEDADDENANLDPVDLRRCSDPDQDEDQDNEVNAFSENPHFLKTLTQEKLQNFQSNQRL